MLRRGFVNAVVRSPLTPQPVRRRVLRIYGLDVGDCTMLEPCFVGGPDIAIGDGTFVNVGCVFDNNARIEIGKRCNIGQRVTFLTTTHEIEGPERRAGRAIHAAVAIGDGCWIGSGVTIQPGVTVGAGCVIGAGSLVRIDCEPNGVYVGVPARRIRDLP